MLSHFPQNNQKKYARRCGTLVLFVLTCILVSGCGQTGPLKLPEDDKKEEADK